MTDSERLARVETLMEAVAKKLGIELPERNSRDDAGYERAIQALANGDRKALSNYVKRGGKIPC